MSEHDYSIANQSFPAARGDINDALAAILSQNSKTSEPTVKVAGMLWYDTTNGLLKQRNSTNAAWNIIGQLNKDGDGVLTNAGSPVLTVAGWYVGQRCIDTTNNRLFVAMAANGTAAGTRWQLAYTPPVNATAPAYTNASTVTLASGTRYTSNDGAIDMILSGDVTVSLASSGAGGREAGSGAEASNTWYYVHVIGDSTGVNPTSAVFSTSRTAGGITLPSGYDKSFVIPKFAVRNDGSSDLVPFTIQGWPFAPYIKHDVTLPRANASNGPTVVRDDAAGAAQTSFDDVSLAAFVPPISRTAKLWLGVLGGSTGAEVRVRRKGASHNGKSVYAWTSDMRYPTLEFDCDTDASQVVQYQSTAADPRVQIHVAGWYG